MSIDYTDGIMDEQLPDSERKKVLVLDRFIGQRAARKKADSIIDFISQKDIHCGHILITGADREVRNSFLEALCNSLSEKLNVQTKVMDFGGLQSPGDIVGELTNLNECDVFGLNNIRSSKSFVDEILAPALSDYALDIILGKGPSATSIHLDTAHFSSVISADSLKDVPPEIKSSVEFMITLNDFEYSERLDYIEDYSKQQGVIISDAYRQALASEYDTIIEIRSELNMLAAKTTLGETAEPGISFCEDKSQDSERVYYNYDDIYTRLVEMIKAHPEIQPDTKAYESMLKDIFPGERDIAYLFSLLGKMRIASIPGNEKTVINRCESTLMDNYAVRKNIADFAATIYVRAYSAK